MDRRNFIGTAGLALLGGMIPRLAAAAASGNAADAKLAATVEAIFNDTLARSPETATALGFDKGPRAAEKKRLDDYSKGGQATALTAKRARLAELRTIDRASLSKSAKLNYDVVVYLMEAAV